MFIFHFTTLGVASYIDAPHLNLYQLAFLNLLEKGEYKIMGVNMRLHFL